MEWTECARSKGVTNEEIISIGPLNPLVEKVWTYNFLDGVTSTSLFIIYLSDDSTVEPAGALKPRPAETVPVQSISTENAFNGPTTTKPPSISLYIEDRRALRHNDRVLGASEQSGNGWAYRKSLLKDFGLTFPRESFSRNPGSGQRPRDKKENDRSVRQSEHEKESAVNC